MEPVQGETVEKHHLSCSHQCTCVEFLQTSFFYAGNKDSKIYIGAMNSSSDYATQAPGSVSEQRYHLLLWMYDYVGVIFNSTMVMLFEH